MFEKILIASEIVPGFDDVLRCVNSLKKIGTRNCLLLQCLSPQEVNDTLSTFTFSIFHDHLARQKEALIQYGFDVSVKELFGVLTDEINRIALEEDCSLIVTGPMARSMIGNLLTGGVAFDMLYHAKKPLLIARAPNKQEPVITGPAACDLTGHVLFPTDFSENANLAFACLKQMVVDGIRKVTLLHVQDRVHIEPHLLDRLDEFNETDTGRLRQMARDLEVAGAAEVSITLLYGSPSAEILRLVKEQNISMVIMGSQGRGFIKEIYLGSVSHTVARQAAAAVLLIPIDRGKTAGPGCSEEA